MQFLKAFLIHFIVPAIGVLWFLRLREEMLEEEIEYPPIMPLFFIFATYGGLLLMILTMLLWYMSGLAFLGFFYLLFLAPIIMLIIILWIYPRRGLSRFHRATYIASVCYIGLLAFLTAFAAIWIRLYGK